VARRRRFSTEPFGPTVERLMGETGVTYRALADQTELSAGYLNHLVHGNRPVPSDDVVKRITDRMMFGLRGQAPDHPNVLAELATRQGFDFRIEKTPPRVTVASPKAMREQIETRALSQLWDLPTERWLQHVEPALAALREIGDEPLPSREAQLVAVLDKPTEPARRIQ
jgi:hypothetical protein